jgi:hypothetical protein
MGFSLAGSGDMENLNIQYSISNVQYPMGAEQNGLDWAGGGG